MARSDPLRHASAALAAWTLAWALLTVLAWDLPLNNDIGWQYWVARQLLGGARFYRDIRESNPPLWFWEAMPLTAWADRFGVAPTHLAVAAVMARIVAAAALIGALSDRRAGLHRIGAVTILVVLGAFAFGERDHLMAIGALPYAMLIARRAGRVHVAVPLAIGVAVLAGWGFALKPHFLLVPVLIEGWLALQLRRDWRSVRPETVTLTVLALAYAAAILILTPAYLTEELPRVFSAYGDFKPPFGSLWTSQIYAPVWLLAAMTAVVIRQRRPVVACAAVAAVACLGIYALQGKGFAYHATPVTIAVAWMAWLSIDSERRRWARMVAWLPLATAILMAVLIGPYRPPRLGTIASALDRLPPGATFALISAHSWDAFPLIERQRLVWPMRGLLLWTLPTIARTGPDTPLARQVRGEVIDDLWCHPPDAILFDDPRRSPAMPRTGPGAGFDYRTFALADPAARRLLSAYRLTAQVDGATLWQRIRPIAPHGAGCRTITIRPAANHTAFVFGAISLFRAPASDSPRTASPPTG